MHSTNPDHPESLMKDSSEPPRLKEHYWNQAEKRLRKADMISHNDKRVLDAQGAMLSSLGL